MDVLVLTVVHTPLDARVYNRQIRTLLDAGHVVRYAAPFSGYGISTEAVDPRLQTVDMPRSVGRRRLHAMRAARRLATAATEDVVIIHDPELVLALAAARTPPIIWDMHEDLVNSLADKSWLPARLHSAVSGLVRWLERLAERRHEVMLAEAAYQERFQRTHPIFPNYPWLPPTPARLGRDLVVYLGRVSVLRGGLDLVEVARLLEPHGVNLHVMGPVDAGLRAAFDQAHAEGLLRSDGFVPNDEALSRLDGALAGLSLLHDHPNYRHSLPTKVLEYQAAGLPVISTPLPEAERAVRAAGSGVVVEFGDPRGVVAAILQLRGDPERAARLGAAGRRAAETGGSWDAIAGDFVSFVSEVAARRRNDQS